jgi:hypothetical protein
VIPYLMARYVSTLLIPVPTCKCIKVIMNDFSYFSGKYPGIDSSKCFPPIWNVPLAADNGLVGHAEAVNPLKPGIPPNVVVVSYNRPLLFPGYSSSSPKDEQIPPADSNPNSCCTRNYWRPIPGCNGGPLGIRDYLNITLAALYFATTNIIEAFALLVAEKVPDKTFGRCTGKIRVGL